MSAKLPISLQLGVHQLILDIWKKTGRKPSQNQIFVDAIREFLVKSGVDMNQIEQIMQKAAPKENSVRRVARFPRVRR